MILYISLLFGRYNLFPDVCFQVTCHMRHATLEKMPYRDWYQDCCGVFAIGTPAKTKRPLQIFDKMTVILVTFLKTNHQFSTSSYLTRIYLVEVCCHFTSIAALQRPHRE